MDIKKLNFSETMEQHDKLFHEGFDVCKGCVFERYAACHEDRVEYCKEQIQKVIDKPDEMKRPCWWEKY